MALRKQLLELSLAGGINTKVDKKKLPPGELFLLENAQRIKQDLVQKRPGSAKVGDSVVGEATQLSNADALGAYGLELLQFQKQSVYSYSEQADRWSNKGAALSCRVRLTDLVKNNYSQTQVDQAVLNDIGLIAWEDSRGGIRCTVYDHSSQSQLLSDAVVSATGTRPRCCAFGGYLFVFYLDGTNLRARQINPVNPSPLGAEVTLSAAANATATLDVIAQDSIMLVSFNGSAATTMFVQRVNANLAVQSTATISEAATNALALIKGPMARTFVLWHTAANNLRCAIYDINGTQTVAPFTVEALAGIEAITGYALPDGSGIRIFHQVDAALSYNHYVRTGTITNGGVGAGLAVFLRSVGLSTKAFALSPDTTDRGFVGLVHESTLQSTYFIARNDGVIVAKLGAGLAGGLLSRPIPSGIWERETGVFSFAALTKNPVVEAQNKSFLSFKGVSILELDFSAQSNFSSVEFGKNAYILGGLLGSYDGQSVVEHGFNLYPENVSAAQGTGGSLTALGTYQYRVVYQWTDAKGQLHRSAPSDPLTVVLTGVNNRVTLTIPTLRLTEKKGARTNVEIVVFRTETLGLLSYRASSATSLTYNDTTVDTVTVVDDLSDANLITREPIYTTGDILENEAPPAASFGTVWGERVVLGGLEDGSLWLSKKYEIGKPAEFSSQLVVALNQKGGQDKACANLGDKLLIFKESSIYYIYGEGPDALGNGQWSKVIELSDDIGAIDSVSIAETLDGTIFKSRKGIYIIKGDLSLVYIGAQVENWNTETITSASVIADLNEVRFTTLNGPTLVYNYFFGQWAVWPNTSANDSVVVNNKYYYVRNFSNADSVVVKEVPGTFKDIDQYYPMRIGIGWLSFAGLAGYQRIYKLFPVGSYKSVHKLRARLAYNYSESYNEEKIWDAGSFFGQTTYGDSSPYGSEPLYGGTDQPYLIRIDPTRQTCTAIRCILEDINPDGTGESFDLTSIAVELGIKKGGFKLPSDASV